MQKRLHAKNKTQLHQILGISRPALERLFKRGDYPPQVPGQGWPIDQWKRYAANNIATWQRRDPHKNGSNGNGVNLSPRDVAFIARQKVSEEKERFNLDVQRGKYELKSDTRGIIATGFGLLTRELDKALRHELPPRLEGASAGKIAELLGKRFDEIRERVAKSLEGTNGHSASVG